MADTADAELENSEEVLEEAESLRAAAAENDDLSAADVDTEALLEQQAEDESLTAAELAVENIPPADEIDLPELEAEQNEIGKTEKNEEDGA